MIRVIYLLTTKDRPRRCAFTQASLDGEKWTFVHETTGKRQNVSDRDMVERAAELRGWTASVYRLGVVLIVTPAQSASFGAST